MAPDPESRQRLRAFFREALARTEPHESPEQPPQRPQRPTSVAKEVAPDALSQARTSREEFERAADGKVAEKGIQPRPPAPRHAPARPLDMRPDGRRWWERPTRETFRRKQAQERAHARSTTKELRRQKDGRGDDDDGRNR
jgi:hypothetical protein